MGSLKRHLDYYKESKALITQSLMSSDGAGADDCLIKLMAREVSLTDMLTAVEEHQPVATLILDPSLNSLTFYKYKGTLVDGREPTALAHHSTGRAAKYAIKSGDTLAIFLPEGSTLQEIFDPSTFLPQTLVKSELTHELLSIYKDDPDDVVVCDREFRFVVIVRSDEAPAWAQEFIEAGRLRTLRIV